MKLFEIKSQKRVGKGIRRLLSPLHASCLTSDEGATIDPHPAYLLVLINASLVLQGICVSGMSLVASQ